ncbi:MAG: hypothetical protein N4A35_11670 [Flavobacteriales bacterium]|jgi:uncharacterized membrane protein|nr:hypothetical protein [Flavobacteriales bacterium]
MKPLIVLLASFFIAILILRLVQQSYNFSLAGRIAMSCMLLFTAIGHFIFTKGMTMMLPKFIPYRTFAVYATGIFEILFAIGLLTKDYQLVTTYFLVLFFIVMLPVNIYATYHHIDYQKGTLDGPGLSYLWFRVPLQVFFILWIYMSVIKI